MRPSLADDGEVAHWRVTIERFDQETSIVVTDSDLEAALAELATAPAPSLEESTRGAFGLEQLLAGNPERARSALEQYAVPDLDRTRIRRFLKGGEIRVIALRAATRFEARSIPSRWPPQMKMPSPSTTSASPT